MIALPRLGYCDTEQANLLKKQLIIIIKTFKNKFEDNTKFKTTEQNTRIFDSTQLGLTSKYTRIRYGEGKGCYTVRCPFLDTFIHEVRLCNPDLHTSDCCNRLLEDAHPAMSQELN